MMLRAGTPRSRQHHQRRNYREKKKNMVQVHSGS
jgi:hypothetical protein